MSRKKKDSPVEELKVEDANNPLTEEKETAIEANNSVLEAEILDGDTISANDTKEVIKEETVVVCANIEQGLDVETPYGDFSIHSNSYNLIGQKESILPAKGTYGITMNVPKAAWEYFAKERKDWGVLKNGLIFATTIDKVRSEVASHKGTVNGFEPVDLKEEKKK